MNDLLAGLLAAVLSTNPVAAVSNLVVRHTGVTLTLVNPNDPVEKEFQRLLAADDEAQAEVDRWIRGNEPATTPGAEVGRLTLNARIEQRFEPVLKAYEDFLARHPDHTRARLAYGSFLNDIKRDGEAMVQWEKARELDPKNPAAWNNLADYYSHRGPVSKAFQYLEKAIELNPFEPVYYQNFATLVFLFRKDVKEVYHLEDDQKVFRRAIDLYLRARQLDPQNFTLATDLAQVYYYLKPAETGDQEAAKQATVDLAKETIAAWDEALKLARTDLDRQGVYIHLARVCIQYGRYADARKHLAGVTEPTLAELKRRITRNLEAKEAGQPAKEE